MSFVGRRHHNENALVSQAGIRCCQGAPYPTCDLPDMAEWPALWPMPMWPGGAELWALKDQDRSAELRSEQALPELDPIHLQTPVLSTQSP